MYCPKCKTIIVDEIKTDDRYIYEPERDTIEVYDIVNVECFCRECNTTFYIQHQHEEN